MLYRHEQKKAYKPFNEEHLVFAYSKIHGTVSV